MCVCVCVCVRTRARVCVCWSVGVCISANASSRSVGRVPRYMRGPVPSHSSRSKHFILPSCNYTYHCLQATTLCILVSHVVLNLLANIQWLKLTSVKEPKEPGHLNDSRVKLSQVAEMLALVSGVMTPVFCFLWPRFRDECRKVLSINTEVPTRSFVSTRSRSVVSFR